MTFELRHSLVFGVDYQHLSYSSGDHTLSSSWWTTAANGRGAPLDIFALIAGRVAKSLTITNTIKVWAPPNGDHLKHIDDPWQEVELPSRCPTCNAGWGVFNYQHPHHGHMRTALLFEPHCTHQPTDWTEVFRLRVAATAAPVAAAPVAKPSADPGGLSCCSCGNFYPYAEPNQANGKLVCYSCRQSGYRV